MGGHAADSGGVVIAVEEDATALAEDDLTGLFPDLDAVAVVFHLVFFLQFFYAAFAGYAAGPDEAAFDGFGPVADDCPVVVLLDVDGHEADVALFPVCFAKLVIPVGCIFGLVFDEDADIPEEGEVHAPEFLE